SFAALICFVKSAKDNGTGHLDGTSIPCRRSDTRTVVPSVGRVGRSLGPWSAHAVVEFLSPEAFNDQAGRAAEGGGELRRVCLWGRGGGLGRCRGWGAGFIPVHLSVSAEKILPPTPKPSSGADPDGRDGRAMGG